MFKLYTNKNSLSKRNSRLLQGGDTEINGDKLGWWDKAITQTDISDGIFTITPQFSGRPYYLAEVLYGRSDLEWVILQYNNIVDVTTEFVTGNILTLPHPQRIRTEFLSNPTKSF